MVKNLGRSDDEAKHKTELISHYAHGIVINLPQDLSRTNDLQQPLLRRKLVPHPSFLLRERLILKYTNTNIENKCHDK